MDQLTLKEVMEIRRSIIVKPHEYGYITIDNKPVMVAVSAHVSDEGFKWLKENHPYETDLIIGYALELDYKLKNYNREQWRGRMDRDPDKEMKIKEGRTGLLRSVNHHYKDTDISSIDERFKTKVNTSFGDVEWYVSYFIPAYHPDRWYQPVWQRVREVTERW